MPNVVVGTITLSNDAAEAGVLYLLAQASQFAQLTQAMTAAGTTGVTMNVNATGAVAVGQAVCVGIEIFTVTAKNSVTLTVTRAAVGTTAATHSIGDQVRLLKQPNLVELCKAIIKKAFADALAQNGSTGVAAQQATIATAQAAIQAIQDAAVS